MQKYFNGIFQMVALLTAVCSYTGTAAQFSDSTPYYVKFNSTGLINNTNATHSYVLNNNFKFSVKEKKFTFNTSNSWVYGKQAEQLTNNDISSSVDVDYLKKVKKIYYWGMGNYDKSFSLQITNRFQTGAGIGYVVSDGPRFNLTISNGILYEQNDLYNLATYSTVRNSFRIKFRLAVKELVVLEGTDFLQHAFRNGNDYILLSNTSLSIKLSRWLRLSSTVTYNRVNINNRENLLCTFGLVFERYF